jgi:hypothetical protein
MVPGCVPFKIVSDSPTLHSRWLLFFKVMIISLWNLLQYHSIVRWAIQAQWAEPLVWHERRKFQIFNFFYFCPILMQFFVILMHFLLLLQNDHLNGLLMDHETILFFIFQKGSKIPKFHIYIFHFSSNFNAVFSYNWLDQELLVVCWQIFSFMVSEINSTERGQQKLNSKLWTFLF